MNDFEKAVEVMKTVFGRACRFAVATVCKNEPDQRYADAFFDGSSFYIVTLFHAGEALDIARNPNIMISTDSMYSFKGKAYNIGHPLLPENAGIRTNMIKAFEPQYFLRNNEQDDNICYIRIDPVSGFFHCDGIGYGMDFVSKTVNSAPFVYSEGCW